MNDMSATIVAKSDQINAADLIGTTRTITIREVRIKAGDDQPVSVYFEGDKKAFRPCKGVRRLMTRVWGLDANKYVGQSMKLFQDPTVTYAGKTEGGIRVSHMTGLDEEIIEYMRTSKAATKPYKILPLVAAQQTDKAAEWVADQIAAVAACTDAEALDALTSKGAKPMGKLQTDRPELHGQVLAAYAEKRSQLAGNDPGSTMLDDDDPFGTDDQPTDHTGFVTGIERRIADAPDLDTLDAVQTDLNSNSDNLPDDVTAGLDAAFAARKRALSKAQGGEGK